MKKSGLPKITLLSDEKKLSARVEQCGIAALGRSELIAYRSGKRLTRNQAIRAACYWCMAGYADGKGDCQQSDCPLYPFMPYALKRTKLVAPVQPLPAKNGHAPEDCMPPQTLRIKIGVAS